MIEAGPARWEPGYVELDEAGAHVGEIHEAADVQDPIVGERLAGRGPRAGEAPRQRLTSSAPSNVSKSPRTSNMIVRLPMSRSVSDLRLRDVGRERDAGVVAALLVDVERDRSGEDGLAALQRDHVPGGERPAVAGRVPPA